jgi:hypothetical protein
MLRLRTQSFRRYRLADKLPSPHSEEFFRLLRDRRFLPLSPSEERTYGWVTADNLLVTDFNVDSVIRGNWAAVGLRIDKRTVNKKLLRARIDLDTEARRKASLDAGHSGRLSRDERRELKEQIQQELIKQTPPNVDVVTVLIHPKRRVLHVLSLSKAVNELVRLHLVDTFGVPMSPLTPWRRSAELLADSRLAQELDDLHPTSFTFDPGLSGPGSADASGVSGSADTSRVSGSADTFGRDRGVGGPAAGGVSSASERRMTAEVPTIAPPPPSGAGVGQGTDEEARS